MKILNLYAGVGGNRKHWEGDVTAVEHDPGIAAVYQKLYPGDEIIVGDAHQYYHSEYDFIWSSPPCPTHSVMNNSKVHKPSYPDMGLYQEIILMQHKCDIPWVVENVYPYYTPLIPPKARIGRHVFWANFYIGNMKIKEVSRFIRGQNLNDKKRLHAWLDIHFDDVVYVGNNNCTTQVLRNCVHPNIGRHIMDWSCGLVRQQDDMFSKEALLEGE